MVQYLRAFIAAHQSKARRATPDALWFVGLALIAYGVSMVFLPAGVITAGIGLCFIGYVYGSEEEPRAATGDEA